ncbi:store-operated calcium entry-associated regulatory factor-like [Ruditapes philippinarum]|uniref:store-operated calcium entry-associated regulatory factor-like n=1 Tax=Ruditapes philippinarum TaxID=129788 RepID=UPI00295B5826|nr:store-operated calcium entry-associated regulatory factor-like [Ruditapes philippinarum]
MMGKSFFIELLCVFISVHYISGSKSDRVLLTDVKALTLENGKMTNYRRTSPVPQLKCVGGSASGAFKPLRVQCINQGSDGSDVQWECKTDMDNSYRFGKVEVTCEGYDYPNDPYILKGSCGLEYTIDYTEEGWQRKNHGGSHQYSGGNKYHDDNYHDRSNYQTSYSKKASSVFQDLFYLALIAGIIYIIYKTCIATPTMNSDAPPPYDAHDPPRNPSAPPPPYGFRNEYMPGTGDGMGGGGCSSGAGYTGGQTYTAPGTGTGGGFWSGAFTGGLMGYLLGNRNSNYHTGYRQRPYTSWWGGNNWGTGWGSGWGSGASRGWGSNTYTSTQSSSGFSSAPRSSGTRTASGFGGTSRR